MTKLSRFVSLLAAVALFLGALAPAARAQLDTSYWTGAISKVAVAQFGQSPVCTTVAASGAAQTVNWPVITNGAIVSAGSACYDISVTANLTLSVGGTAVAGQRQVIYVLLRQTGTFTLTLGGTTKWSNNASITLVATAGQALLLQLVTTDGGTTVFAAQG